MTQGGNGAVSPEIEALKEQQELAEAKRAELEAEKALIEARRALAESKKTEVQSPAAQMIAELQSQKSVAEAEKALLDAQKSLADSKKATSPSASSQQLADLQVQKSLADARKALAEAQTQATLANYIGSVKAGPYAGAVTVKNGAGTEEASLLAVLAVREGAERIAKAVLEKARIFYIYSAKDLPTFQRLLAFRVRKALLVEAFTAAGIRRPAELKKAAVEETVTAGVLSAGLDAFSNLLGYFKTDYEVGNIEVKLDESVLMFAVAGRLSSKEVHLPQVYSPTEQDRAVRALAVEMGELVDLRSLAAEEAERTKDQIGKKERMIPADSSNADQKTQIAKEITALQATLAQINGVIALYDQFATSLSTPDPTTGVVPLAALAQECAISLALRGNEKFPATTRPFAPDRSVSSTGAPNPGGNGNTDAEHSGDVSDAAVLLIRLESTGGGYLVKKNLLTALWSMPLYHMGGATVSYLLISGSNGKVIAGDSFPIYGGFTRTDKLGEVLNNDSRHVGTGGNPPADTTKDK